MTPCDSAHLPPPPSEPQLRGAVAKLRCGHGHFLHMGPDGRLDGTWEEAGPGSEWAGLGEGAGLGGSGPANKRVGFNRGGGARDWEAGLNDGEGWL